MSRDRQRQEQVLISEMLDRIEKLIDVSGSIIPEHLPIAHEDRRGLTGWRYLSLGKIYVNDSGSQIVVTLDSHDVYSWVVTTDGSRRISYRINRVEEVLKILRKNMVIDDLADV